MRKKYKNTWLFIGGIYSDSAADITKSMKMQMRIFVNYLSALTGFRAVTTEAN